MQQSQFGARVSAAQYRFAAKGRQNVIFLFLVVLYAITLSAVLAWRGLRTTRRGVLGVQGNLRRRVLIVGATGGTGRQLVDQALQRGHEVTALAREPAALGVEHARLRVLLGDVLDYSSLEAAMQGQDAVISALGHRLFFRPTHILSQGTRNLLQAMEACGVRRIICETALGIGDSGGRLGLSYTFFVIPFILPFYFLDKALQERIIGASKLEWTIVRPGTLTNGPRRGIYKHGSTCGSFLRTVKISRADVAVSCWTKCLTAPI